MDEIITTVTPDAPQDDVTTTAEPEVDTPTTEIEENGDATPQEAEQEDVTEEPEVDQTEEPASVVPIRYNHQYQELSIDDAAEWAQKGMQAESLMADLRYIAAANNQSVAEVVRALKNAHDNSVRERLREKCTDDDMIDQLMEMERSKYRETADRLAESESQARQESADEVNRRLAQEFVDLQKEFPDVTRFEKLPKQVLEMSRKQGLSLLDGYLRYQHAERKKAQVVAAQQKATEKASAGTMQSQPEETIDPAIAAMLAGVAGQSY